jgi:hypothetical protein
MRLSSVALLRRTARLLLSSVLFERELPIVSNEEGSATGKQPARFTSACRVMTIVAN